MGNLGISHTVVDMLGSGAGAAAVAVLAGRARNAKLAQAQTVATVTKAEP
jgi:hypothetical protein